MKSSVVIAEIAQAHDGSLGTAYAYVDLLADLGVDFVKFQLHSAEGESSRYDQFRPGTFFPQDPTRYDYWQRTSFSHEQWINLFNYVRKKGLGLAVTPNSITSLELCIDSKVDLIKIGSGDFHNDQFIDFIIGRCPDMPVVLSVGMVDTMAALSRLEELVNRGLKIFSVLYCVSKYPTPPEKSTLNEFNDFRGGVANFVDRVGYSDHTGQIFASLAVRALGGTVFEHHICFHRGCFGPDVSSSLDPDQFEQLIHGLTFLDSSFSSTAAKRAEVIHDLRATKRLFQRSAYAKFDLKAGSEVRLSDVRFLKPADGDLFYENFGMILGKRLTRPIKTGDSVSLQDFN